MNEKSINNIKQHDPYEWVTNNYAWPKCSNNLIPTSQRLLRLKYFEDFLTNSTRSSTSSSEENNLHHTIIENGQSNSNNQQLVRKLF